ncbi:MAG: hypothetical protein PF541_10620 [Prolixibacteraceae bacterium]|jgi:hypothetical protein|nr:hypothetical protein [Prolixibacteraceae bacterium]
MHTTQNIEYIIARHNFEDAEIRGLKLSPGNINTNIWLHKEAINYDLVVETARRFPDSKTFIIADGINKGFYIYSTLKQVCIKLVNESKAYTHAESA